MEEHSNKFVLSSVYSISGDHHIAVPSLEKWNRKVVLYCHGHEGGETIEKVNRWVRETLHDLLSKNWITAIVAFTEKSWTQEKGVEDVVTLTNAITKTFGNPSKVILFGDSMGGLIVTLAVERENTKNIIHGGVAVGAYLNGPLITKRSQNYRPHSPLIFLSTTNELNQPTNYSNKAQNKLVSLWEAKRFGHCKVNHLECLKAIEAVDAGTQSTGNIVNTTQTPTINTTCTYLDQQHVVKGQVLVVDAHGNISTDVLDSIVTGKLGVKDGQKVFVKVKSKEVQVSYVNGDFSGVPPSTWVAFPSSYGDISVSICLGNAAQELQVSGGEEVEFRV